MEHAVDDARDGSVDVDAFVIPAGDELRDNPFEDLAGDFAGWFVEDVGEVVFGKHGVGRVRGIVVMEDDELFLFAALDDLRRARVELGFYLVDDGEDEGGK